MKRFIALHLLGMTWLGMAWLKEEDGNRKRVMISDYWLLVTLYLYAHTLYSMIASKSIDQSVNHLRAMQSRSAYSHLHGLILSALPR